MAQDIRFTKKTLDFLEEAGRKKLGSQKQDWLDRHKDEHEAVLIAPFRALAEFLAQRLTTRAEARGYKFPRRGFGRLRRPSHKVQPGQVMYRDWVHLQASRPSPSRFDDNPGLYFFLSPERVFAGGGLYMPSSRQIKQLRAWINHDPSEMEELLKSRGFKRVFPQGFEREKVVKTHPRHYSPDHERIELLRLQAYYVTHPFTKRELYSASFKDLVLECWSEGLRFNEVLYEALSDKSLGLASFAARETASDDENEVADELWDERL